MPQASQDELRVRIETIQARTFELRYLALDATLALTRDIQAAVLVDSTTPKVAQTRQQQLRAQFFADLIEAENSMGFYAPQQAARILGHALDEARKGQAALAGLSAGPAMNPPTGVCTIGTRPRTEPGTEGAGRPGWSGRGSAGHTPRHGPDGDV